MKFKIALVLFLVAAAWVVGRQMNSERAGGGDGGGALREETRRSFTLGAGAQVDVRGINGSVEVGPADGDTAEVHVVRTAESRDALDRSRLVIEQAGATLVVRHENTGGGWWSRLFGRGGHARQQVTLSIPRAARLQVKGVNGPVRVGEVGGPVEVAGVNGRVEVAEAGESADVAGVNGGVTVGLGRLGPQGLAVRGVNGSVEVRLREPLDADVEIKGLNGSASFNVPNVTRQEQQSRSNYSARFGAGGAPITVKGVNGSVRFESAAR